MTDLKKLRDYYDSTDQSAAFTDAVLEETVEEPLVSTSIRLSRRTLDQVRAIAAAAGVPATTLMREWVEARVEDEAGGLVVSVAELERFISAAAHRAS
ncbi:hypothetical protein KVF89_11495 [Nocardioides carbamazepini]|uniref:hypothetical protein n=1 Tax=Nocardioides carbamazepini TaxID=2854259 RepID=UPI00214A4DBA|nr:hypothetical protein [Nocardioides carbamazepini]MCR1783158.1 hypothetical protein [Nocardioides carbamazepini]